MAGDAPVTTNATKLRKSAERLRTADDLASRHDAAELLDQLATAVDKARNRVDTWTARGVLAAIAAVPAMLTAGIWVDWRWAATAAVPAAVAVVLLCTRYAAREGNRG